MLQIAAVFAVLLGLSTMAGYVPLRLLGRGLGYSERLALMPLAGASLIGLVALWIHCFVPLSAPLVLVSALPAVAGAALIIKDRHLVRFRMPGRVMLVLWAAGSALIVAPFVLLGGATTFGLYSNDGFWWTVADYIVQNTTQNGTLDSNLVQRSTGFRRYGACYLSVLAQTITGLRSWETIHLTAGFGTFLLIQATWVLARTVRIWWPVAIVVALAAAANHFQYRTFLDAIVAFQFGFAFLVSVIALALRPFPEDWKRRAALIAVLVAGIGTYYTEFLALVGAVTVAGFAGLALTKRLRFRQVFATAAGGIGGVLLLGPFVVNIIAHIGFIAGFQIPVPHYRWNWLEGNILHFGGMMDLTQYSTGPAPILIQYVGVVAAAILLAGALRYAGLRRWLPLGSILLLLLAALCYFVSRKQEYTAHRFAVVMAPFAIVLLFSFLKPRSRAWLAVAAAVTFCGAWPAVRMTAWLPGNYIRVTSDERQIGDEWIPRYVRDGRILIDLPEDLNLFYGHYMYWETMRALGNKESRIVYSGPFYSFVPSTSLEMADVKYILRRRKIGLAVGAWKVLASNDRYELLELHSAGEIAMVHFKGGFHGLEGTPEQNGRWMSQDGELIVTTARPLTMKFDGYLHPSPRVPATVVQVLQDGHVLGEYPVPQTNWLHFEAPVKAGDNQIVFRSSQPPLEPGNGDSRLMSVQVANVTIQVSEP